jgi:capsid protein
MANDLAGAKVDGGKRRRGKRGGRKHRESAQAGELVSVDRGKLIEALSSYEGARRESMKRGRVILPNANPERAVSSGDRVEIAQKVRAGEQNVGLVKRTIEVPARLVGNLKPQAATGNEDFDAEVEERFWSRAEHAAAFDAAGRFSFLDWQRWCRESKRRDGDALSVLTEGSEGGGRLRCYEALQIGDGHSRGRNRPKNLVDGVFLDKFGGRAGFQLLDGNGKASAVVPRDRAIYHGCEVRVGRPRSVSPLAHSIANFLDATEILSDSKTQVKVAALWGAWVESDKDGGADPGEDLKDLLRTAGETADALDEFVEAGEPTSEELGEVIGAEDFLGGGRMQEFGAGKSLKTMKNDNPGPNVMGLLSWLVRDICADVSPEVLWDASKMSGPGMRFVMAELRRFIAHEQEVNRRDCQRVWMYLLAKEAKMGRLVIPAEVENSWWKASWIPEADLTIDRGRDGKLDLELLDKGLMTKAEFWGRQGKDWKEEEDRVLRERIWIEAREKELRGD